MVANSSSAPGRRASDVLEALLAKSATQGEVTLAYLRVIVGSLAVTKFLVTAFLRPSTPGLHSALDTSVIGLGILFSLGILAAARRGAPSRRLSVASIAFDAYIAFQYPAVDALLPEADYQGIVNSPVFALPCLVAATAGLRPSRRESTIGVAAASVAMLGTVVLEALVGTWTPSPFERTGFALALFSGFAALGYVLAQRTRRLVYAAADAALEAERVRQRLGAYVSEAVAQQALGTQEPTLGGRRQPVAVLFSDLRGFTSWSERSEPERIVAELNAYLDAMVAAVRAEGGVVDKYIGDSLMVVFGIPEPRPDDAGRAIRAAAAMQRALVEHNRQRAAQGLEPLAQGVGVHFGPAVAGNIGTADHLQYTVVGDTVNLASRLESATKELRVGTLISSDAVDAAKAAGPSLPGLLSRGRIRVKGREAEIEVYSLAAADGSSAAA